MSVNQKSMKEAILTSLQQEAKRPSALLAEFGATSSPRQIESVLSELLEQGLIEVGPDRKLITMEMAAA